MTEDQETRAAQLGWAIARADRADDGALMGDLMAGALDHGREVHDAAIVIAARVLNVRPSVEECDFAIRELGRQAIRSRDW